MSWNNLGTWNSLSNVTAATISAVTSSRGADIATANEALTITVDDSASISAVTVNGESCTSVSIVNGTTVTCTCPLGFGAAYGTSGNVVVNNGVDSAGYSVTLMQPSGMSETDFTVAYASLSTDSPFSGNTSFSTLVSGDSCIYDALSSPDSHAVTMSGDGEFTLAGTITQTQTFDYYIYDASDNTVSATIEQITVNPTAAALTATSVETATEVTTPSISQSQILTVSSVQSTSNVTAPAVGQNHQVSAADVSVASSVSVPTITQQHALLATNIESAGEVSAPVASDIAPNSLVAVNVESAATVSAPNITQRHALLPTSAESAGEVSAPVVADIAGDALVATSIESATTVATPAVTQHHVLSVVSNDSASSVDAPTIGQSHGFIASFVDSQSEVTAPAFWQEHAISADDIQSAAEVTNPTVIEPGDAVQIIGGNVTISRVVASTQTINRTITHTGRLS